MFYLLIPFFYQDLFIYLFIFVSVFYIIYYYYSSFLYWFLFVFVAVSFVGRDEVVALCWEYSGSFLNLVKRVIIYRRRAPVELKNKQQFEN